MGAVKNGRHGRATVMAACLRRYVEYSEHALVGANRLCAVEGGVSRRVQCSRETDERSMMMTMNGAKHIVCACYQCHVVCHVLCAASSRVQIYHDPGFHQPGYLFDARNEMYSSDTGRQVTDWMFSKKLQMLDFIGANTQLNPPPLHQPLSKATEL